MRNLWMGAALAVLVVLVSGCANEGVSTGSRFSPLYLKLSVVGQPSVNNTFTLVTTMWIDDRGWHPNMSRFFEGARLDLAIPDGVEVISGPTNWTGNLDNRTTVTLKTELKITRDGGFQIEAFESGPEINGNWLGEHETIYIESSPYGYDILPWRPFGTHSQGEPIKPLNNSL